MLQALVEEVDTSPGPLLAAFSPLPLDPSLRHTLFHDLHAAVKVGSGSAPCAGFWWQRCCRLAGKTDIHA